MELSSSKIKKYLIFQEKELSSSKIKKILIFPEMDSGNGTFQRHIFLTFQEGTFRARKTKKNILKKFLKFLEIELSSSYIFCKSSFLYFRRELAKPEKQKFLIFL